LPAPGGRGELEAITRVLTETLQADNPGRVPTAIWVKTRKGRGIRQVRRRLPRQARTPATARRSGRPSARSPNATGSPSPGFGAAAPRTTPRAAGAVPAEPPGRDRRAAARPRRSWTTSRPGWSRSVRACPRACPHFRLGSSRNPFADPGCTTRGPIPAELFAQPKERRANREALGKWGAWVNALGAKEYGQPLFLASSADLAGSTNIAGFGGPSAISRATVYERHGGAEGALLPQEITEFANSGIMTGTGHGEPLRGTRRKNSAGSGDLVHVRLVLLPPVRDAEAVQQLAQDCDIKVGKVVFVAGHSGPETADEAGRTSASSPPGSRSSSPREDHQPAPLGVQRGPGAASPQHFSGTSPWWRCTSPGPGRDPDRQALGIPSHFERRAAPTSCWMRTAAGRRPGTVIVQGTSAMAAIVKLLPDLAADEREGGLRHQPAALRRPAESPTGWQVLSEEERLDSTVITTQARWL